MRFGEPQWLWGLLLLPLLYLWIFHDLRTRKRLLQKIIDQDLWKDLLPDLDWSARFRKGVFWTLGVACIFLALARPQWGKSEETVKISGLDILVILDLSNSMEVEDVVPSRLARAKRTLRKLTERAQGDRVGVIAFAGSAFVVCPLTNDLDYVNQVLDTLTPRMIGRQGTDIGLALKTAAEAMGRGAQDSGLPGGADSGGGPVSKVLLLISDGEDLGGRVEEGLKDLKKQSARLYVFGVGTEKGGQIPVRDEDGVLRGYKRQGSEFVVSRFNPSALKKLASQAGGEYFELSDRESDLEPLFQELGKMSRSEVGERKYVIYHERYQIPLTLALLFLGVELTLSLRRRSAILAGIVLSVFSWVPSVQAGTHPGAYIDNQDGITALEQGKSDEALEKFGSAQAAEPSSPELKYNLGITHTARENWDAALQELQESRDAFLERKDFESASRAEYNIGSALEKKKQIQEAVRAYRRAIEQAQTAEDKKTETDARIRIERLIQQQRQSQPQQGDDSNQKPKDNQEQSQQSQSGQKQFQSPKKSFRSEKLSKDAADRVMNELQNQEKQIQGRIKKQKGADSGSGQDW
jgi:Ca-activated chloride channel family protein